MSFGSIIGKQERSETDLKTRLGKEKGILPQPLIIWNSNILTVVLGDNHFKTDTKTDLSYEAET